MTQLNYSDVASTVVLTGTVVVEGVVFRWSVTGDQHITVGNQTIGAKTLPLAAADPESQARAMGRELLDGHTAATGFLEAVDDAPLSDDEPDPPAID
jgi:hypothetical protein